MEAYKNWVRTNKDYVHSLESLANGLTWFLPERFSDSEIGPEAVTTILGIVTAINEYIIDGTPLSIARGPKESSPFPYPLCISAIKDLESLVEVVAQQIYGDGKKWNFIAITEGTKVLVRLALFSNSGYKMLLHGGETPNDEDKSDASSSNQKSEYFQKAARPAQGHGKEYSWKLEHKALCALSRFGERARMTSGPTWLHRVQHQFAIINPSTPLAERPNLSTIFSERGLYGGLFAVGEVLHITRPLLYVLLMRKYGIRSWVPWFLSLVVDLIGTGILSLVTTPWKNNHPLVLSTSEDNEVKRRKLLWALYLFRDPFFSKYTRRKLGSAEKLLEPIPVVGFLTAKIFELISGAQTRYTYVSAS